MGCQEMWVLVWALPLTLGKSHLISEPQCLHQESHLSFFFFVSTKLFLSIYYMLTLDDRHWGTQGPLRLSVSPLVVLGPWGPCKGVRHSIGRPVGAQRREWPILFGGLGDVFQKKMYKLSCKEGLVRWGVFPGSSESKESACSAGDLSLIPELGRSPGEGNGYPLQ